VGEATSEAAPEALAQGDESPPPAGLPRSERLFDKESWVQNRFHCAIPGQRHERDGDLRTASRHKAQDLSTRGFSLCCCRVWDPAREKDYTKAIHDQLTDLFPS